MTENCVFIEVKQEFQEDFDKTAEEVDEITENRKESNSIDDLCCLCSEGLLLQNQLIDHIKIHYCNY